MRFSRTLYSSIYLASDWPVFPSSTVIDAGNRIRALSSYIPGLATIPHSFSFHSFIIYSTISNVRPTDEASNRDVGAPKNPEKWPFLSKWDTQFHSPEPILQWVWWRYGTLFGSEQVRPWLRSYCYSSLRSYWLFVPWETWSGTTSFHWAMLREPYHPLFRLQSRLFYRLLARLP